MIGLSRNLKVFGSIFAFYSLGFHYLLSRSLAAAHYDQIWMFASGYGLATFFTALILGAFDPVRRGRGDLGFQYHLVTYVVSVGVYVVWIFAGPTPEKQAIPGYLIGMGAWGLGLFVHYLASRATIKGISKRKMFE